MNERFLKNDGTIDQVVQEHLDVLQSKANRFIESAGKAAFVCGPRQGPLSRSQPAPAPLSFSRRAKLVMTTWEWVPGVSCGHLGNLSRVFSRGTVASNGERPRL